MKTAKEILTKYSDGSYTQFKGYENILMAMEEYASQFKESAAITDEEIEKWAENYESNRIGILGQHIVSMQHKSGLVEGGKAMRDNVIKQKNNQ